MPLPRVRADGLARLAILLSLVSSIGTSTATVQSRVIAFTNVTLIDGTGAAPRTDLTVVVDGSQISAIGRSGTVRVPAEAQRVDGRAKFLIPGLWDMHVHLGTYDSAAKTLPRLVAYGITGVRDMASPVDDIVSLAPR